MINKQMIEDVDLDPENYIEKCPSCGTLLEDEINPDCKDPFGCGERIPPSEEDLDEEENEIDLDELNFED